METLVSAVSVLIILGGPLLEPLGFSYGIIEDSMVRLLLIVFVVCAIRLGHMPGLLAFLATFSLLIERNHEVLTQFPNQRPSMQRPYDGYPRAAAPISGEIEEIPFNTPHVGDSGRTVVESHGETTTVKEFENTDGLRDNIPRMAEAPRTQTAPQFYRSKGLL